MGDKRHPQRTAAFTRLPFLILGTALLTAVVLLSGVGLAAIVGQRGTAENWGRLSDVGQTFGALSSIISGFALCVVVVTAHTHLRELRRSASADLSSLHLEILRMSIDDEAALRTLEYLFTSQKIRRYWAAAARARESLVPGSPEYLFAKEADRICRDYNAVASNSSNVEQNVTNYKESSGRSPRKQPNAATRSEHPGLGKIVAQMSV